MSGIPVPVPVADADATRPCEGSCLCGAVRYAVDMPLRAITHCHCSQCRKFHGAAFATYASVRQAAFRWTRGSEALRSFSSSPGVTRMFCGICGSSLTWQSLRGAYPDWISLALGTLDTPVSFSKQRHVHVDSKAPWHEIRDDGPVRP